MAKRDDIPKIDPSEIEALIKRLKQSNIEPREFCARGVFGVHASSPGLNAQGRRQSSQNQHALRPWVDFRTSLRTSSGNEPLTAYTCLHFSFEVYLRPFCRRSRLRQY